MTKIISVKSLGGDRFEVLFYLKRLKRKEIIVYKKDFWLESLEENMPYWFPENAKSSELLNHNIIFRKELFRLIKQEIEKKQPELQVV